MKGLILMKKILLFLTSIILIVLNLVGCSSNKETQYTLKREQEIMVGNEIPAGEYSAKILSNGYSTVNICEIKKIDGLKGYGEDYVGKLIEDESDMTTYVYEVKLPKGKIISSNADVLLIKK